MTSSTSNHQNWWDISMYNPEGSATIENAPTESVKHERLTEEVNQLLEKEYRKTILYGLLEVFWLFKCPPLDLIVANTWEPCRKITPIIWYCGFFSVDVYDFLNKLELLISEYITSLLKLHIALTFSGAAKILSTLEACNLLGHKRYFFLHCLVANNGTMEVVLLFSTFLMQFTGTYLYCYELYYGMCAPSWNCSVSLFS